MQIPGTVGKYVVSGKLGEGGMAVVYRARDLALQRTVAVKVIKPEAVESEHGQELKERFLREARAVAALNHRHIVTIFEIGEQDGKPFIAMEYLEGDTLAFVIRQRQPLTIDRRIRLILKLCAGLEYAHRAGIIHRDIKPANVMVTAEDELKILDFGLARLAADASGINLTRFGAVMGTPQYSSPEQARGEGLDVRTDVFSVTAVLYELLSYRKAFTGDSYSAILNQVLHTDPAPLSATVLGLSSEFDAIVAQGLAKDRAQRYQTLGALRHDLEMWLAVQASDTLVSTATDDATPPAHRSDRVASGSGGVGKPDSARASPLPGAISGRDRQASLEQIARRRASEIASHVTKAEQHLVAGEHTQANAACEQALLLNPEEPRALALLETIHGAARTRQVERWLEQARQLVADGALTAAQGLVSQAIEILPDSSEALAIQRELEQRREAEHLAAEQGRVSAMAVERGRADLHAGRLDDALAQAGRALELTPDALSARDLQMQAQHALATRRQREEELEARAAAAARRDREAAAQRLHDAVAQQESDATGVREREATGKREREAETQRQPARLARALEVAPDTWALPTLPSPDPELAVTPAVAEVDARLEPAPARGRWSGWRTLVAGGVAVLAIGAAWLGFGRSEGADVGVRTVLLDIRPWAQIESITASGQTVTTDCGATPCTVLLTPGTYHILGRNPFFPAPVEFDVTVTADAFQEVRRSLPHFSADQEAQRILEER